MEIRKRARIRRSQRSSGSSGRPESRRFMEYRAKIAGLPVIVVDPKNTSRECPVRHYTDKRNRQARDVPKRLPCVCAAPARHVGAMSVRDRVVVSQPIVARSHWGCKPTDISRGSPAYDLDR
ncbi:MAG: zinc ribbon domain-containing protein [Thermoprotei archaeon]|nr:zinc ribbon domain-containing protein [TACK group archaeon]